MSIVEQEKGSQKRSGVARVGKPSGRVSTKVQKRRLKRKRGKR